MPVSELRIEKISVTMVKSQSRNCRGWLVTKMISSNRSEKTSYIRSSIRFWPTRIFALFWPLKRVFNPPDNMTPVHGCVIFKISFRDSVTYFGESSSCSSKLQHRKNDRENQDKLWWVQGNIKVNSKPVALELFIGS